SCRVGGGSGSIVLSPTGASGVITMKMMISTNNTSINGVMLISAFCGPLPSAIPMAYSTPDAEWKFRGPGRARNRQAAAKNDQQLTYRLSSYSLSLYGSAARNAGYAGTPDTP